MTIKCMVQQIEIILKPKRRGFHLVTSEILSQLPKLPKIGIVNIFTKHTSCGLSINENADPDVRLDMETSSTDWFLRTVQSMSTHWRVPMICLLMPSQH